MRLAEMVFKSDVASISSIIALYAAACVVVTINHISGSPHGWDNIFAPQCWNTYMQP